LVQWILRNIIRGDGFKSWQTLISAAIARVVERLQHLNIVRRRLSVEFSSNDLLHIEVDLCGVADEQLTLIIGKIRQAATTVNAYWHRLD
jgi:hypothetical protein